MRGITAGEEIRENIISTLRGRYATSILSAIGYLGIADKLLLAPCSIRDFKEIENKHVLGALLNYLVSINFLTRQGDVFCPTDMGRHILKRTGSASIIESYNQYMTLLPDLLNQNIFEQSKSLCAVDRPLNVYGSGDIHRRKFFPKAIGMIRSLSPESLIDLGCGDGTFLEKTAFEIPSTEKLIGIDLSSESTEIASQRLQSFFSDKDCYSITCDAWDVAKWSKDLPDVGGEEAISAWFVLHEFSEGRAEKIIEFFKNIHIHRPRAYVLIGELVWASPEELAKNSSKTIMPEFLLFHELSGQAPLSWDDWNKIKNEIPYKLVSECIFDAIEVDEDKVPSNFIWLLQPAAIVEGS